VNEARIEQRPTFRDAGPFTAPGCKVTCPPGEVLGHPGFDNGTTTNAGTVIDLDLVAGRDHTLNTQYVLGVPAQIRLDYLVDARPDLYKQVHHLAAVRAAEKLQMEGHDVRLAAS